MEQIKKLVMLVLHDHDQLATYVIANYINAERAEGTPFCSPAEIRKALRMLEADGLVTSYRELKPGRKARDISWQISNSNEFVTDADIENLKHMLGADSRYRKSQWGFRNRFSAGGTDIESMQRLRKAGFTREVKSSFCEHLYVATETGCRRLGFNSKQIANAMDF